MTAQLSKFSQDMIQKHTHQVNTHMVKRLKGSVAEKREVRWALLEVMVGKGSLKQNGRGSVVLCWSD